jgi:ATP-binding cassette subfamily F protein 3
LWRKQGKPLALDLPAVSVNGHQPAPPAPSNAKRINPMKLRQMQDRCHEIEREIAAAESEIAGHESSLGNFVSTGETLRIAALIEKRRKDLSALLAEWERVSQELEAGAADKV